MDLHRETENLLDSSVVKGQRHTAWRRNSLSRVLFSAARPSERDEQEQQECEEQRLVLPDANPRSVRVRPRRETYRKQSEAVDEERGRRCSSRPEARSVSDDDGGGGAVMFRVQRL